MNKLLPLLLLLIFAGCKKDDNTTDLLTRSWQTTAVTVKTNGITSSEDISLCSVNRIFTFRKDGSFLNEQSPGCTPTGSSYVFDGTWSLTDKKNLRAVAQNGGSEMVFEGEIITLTNSRLVIRTIVDVFGGGGRAGFPISEVTNDFAPR